MCFAFSAAQFWPKQAFLDMCLGKRVHLPSFQQAGQQWHLRCCHNVANIMTSTVMSESNKNQNQFHFIYVGIFHVIYVIYVITFICVYVIYVILRWSVPFYLR